MAHIVADRIKEETATTGTGDLCLTGAVTGYRTFASVMATGDTCHYCIDGGVTGEWEVGLGTYSATNTLTRTTVLSSSNADSLVSFTAGTSTVYITHPAKRFGATVDTTRPVSISSATSLAFGRHYICSGSDSYTVTLPTVTTADIGKQISINLNLLTSYVVTVDAGSSKSIDGLRTRILWGVETVVLQATSTTSWTKIGGNSIPMCATLKNSANMTRTGGSGYQSAALDTYVSTKSNCSYLVGTCYALKLPRPNLYKVTGFALYGSSNTTAHEIYCILRKNSTNALGKESYAYSPASTAMTASVVDYIYGIDSDGYGLFVGYSDGAYSTTMISAEKCTITVQEICQW